MRRSRARRRTSLRGLRPPALCLRRPLRRLQVGELASCDEAQSHPKRERAGERRRQRGHEAQSEGYGHCPRPRHADQERDDPPGKRGEGTSRRHDQEGHEGGLRTGAGNVRPIKGKGQGGEAQRGCGQTGADEDLGLQHEGALLARDDAERRSGGEREGQREAAVVDEGIERQKKRLACLHPSEQRAKRYRCQNVAQHACKYSAISAVEHQYYPFIRIIKILYRKYRDYIILYLVLFLIGVHLDRSLASPQGMARRRRVRC